MNYTVLQAAIAENMHRNDLAAVIPGFIERAESFMFRELNIRDIETSATEVTTGNLITFPVDFAYLVKVTTTQFGREYILDYAADPYAATSGLPTSYTMESGGLRIYPSASTGFAYKIYYGAKVGNLTATAPINWLITNAYDLYLQASLLEAHRYAQDEAQIGAVTNAVGGMLDSVRRLIERKGQPSQGSMQIKPRR